MYRLSVIALISAVIALTPATSNAGLKLPWRGKQKAPAAAKPTKASTKQMKRIERDVQRLESLLAELKTSANISDSSWKKVTAEANELAVRIHANVKSATREKKALRAAEDLRHHVEQMKKEVAQRDYRSTRKYAERALGAAAKLDEWAG